jgi:hypothetical protein
MLFGAELLAHGFLNIFRGTLEATISLVTAPLLGIGNLALIPFNRLHFYQPIFSYGSFTRDVIHIPSYTIEVY